MPIRRLVCRVAPVAVAMLAFCSVASAQLTIVESGFLGTTLGDDFAKQIELGVGPDTCLYYGSEEGLKRRCGPVDPPTVCDEFLTFPVGIAFSTGGSFGSAMYVSDYGVGDIYRAAGCVPGTLFATLPLPGSLAFPPAGSPYGDFLYSCVAFDGPIHRVSSTGAVTTWLNLPTAYLRFGPGGAWGTGLYATMMAAPGTSGIVKVSSAGAVTPLISDFFVPEGFDWGFDNDLFATDVGFGQVRRVHPNGTSSLFATLPGAADVAYRPGEQALYVVSNQGGLYRIVRGSTTDVEDAVPPLASILVSPNPARGSCALRFATRTGGLMRAIVLDASGRRVRRLGDSWRPAGAQQLTWDGRDESGALVRAGTYFAQVQADGESRSARITVLR